MQSKPRSKYTAYTENKTMSAASVADKSSQRTASRPACYRPRPL